MVIRRGKPYYPRARIIQSEVTVNRGDKNVTDLRDTRLAELVAGNQQQLLKAWLELQRRGGALDSGQIKEEELRDQSAQFLQELGRALRASGELDVDGAAWQGVRDVLAEVSRSRATRGFTPSQTAMFVFSVKQPLFGMLRAACTDAEQLADETWAATQLLDRLGLHTTELYQKSREEVIRRQQLELLELSTPVVELWDGILALPIIGTLDSERTQMVMENLLQRIVDAGAEIAIIDITGVPTVDTLVAQHLIKTVSAARLMGADCIISGIRPQIAQTIVHLGLELDVVSKATMADAFALALRRTGQRIGRADPAQG
jgi:rsbT co-antagonist protein RsbR